MDSRAWWAAVHGFAKSQTRLSDFTFTFHFHALQKEMATHSSALAWRIPGTGEPGGLLSVGSHRVRHDEQHTFITAMTSPAISYLLGHFSSLSLRECKLILILVLAKNHQWKQIGWRRNCAVPSGEFHSSTGPWFEWLHLESVDNAVQIKLLGFATCSRACQGDLV